MLNERKTVKLVNRHNGKSVNLKMTEEVLTRNQFMRLKRETEVDLKKYSLEHMHRAVVENGNVTHTYRVVPCQVVQRNTVCWTLRVEGLFDD